MKQLLYLIIIHIVVAACSGQHETNSTLNRVATLLDNRPDTSVTDAQLDSRPRMALTLLDSLAPHTAQFPRAMRMRYLLLRAQALNKAYLPIDTIGYMNEVLDYYRTHGSQDEHAQALYMMGSIYRDRHNSPMALQYFREAVTEIDTTRTDCDYLQVSHIYGQMAELFRHQRYPKREISMWRQAAYYANKAKDTLEFIDIAARINHCYFDLNMEDSVLYITEKAYNAYKEIGRKDLAAGKLPYIIYYHLRHQRFSQAKERIDEFKHYSGLFDDKGNIFQGLEHFYLMIGDYYAGISMQDSALWYYYKLISFPNYILNLENGYKGLMNTYLTLGKSDSVAKYAILYADANDTAVARNALQELSRTQALYDYTENQRLAEEKTTENNRLRWVQAGLLVVIAFVLIAILYMKQQYERRIKLRIQETNRNYVETMERYYHNIAELEEIKIDAKKFEKKKRLETDQLSVILSSYKGNDNKNMWSMEQQLMRHSVVQQLHRHTITLTEPTASEWADLDNVIRTLLPHFYQIVNDPQWQLTDREIRVCMLIRLHFIPTEIAILLNLSKQRITNIRAQINLKMFQEKGTKHLNKHIESI